MTSIELDEITFELVNIQNDETLVPGQPENVVKQVSSEAAATDQMDSLRIRQLALKCDEKLKIALKTQSENQSLKAKIGGLREQISNLQVTAVYLNAWINLDLTGSY